MATTECPGTVGAPSFVTVTLLPATASFEPLLSGGDKPCSLAPPMVVKPMTLRVPVTASTTVRELARGAMKRYLLSLRRATTTYESLLLQKLCRTGMVVAGVYLLCEGTDAIPTMQEGHAEARHHPPGSTEPVPIVELLSDDCVTQVVHVMKETVCMRIYAAMPTSSQDKIVSKRSTLSSARTRCSDVTEVPRGEDPVGNDPAVQEKRGTPRPKARSLSRNEDADTLAAAAAAAANSESSFTDKRLDFGTHAPASLTGSAGVRFGDEVQRTPQPSRPDKTREGCDVNCESVSSEEEDEEESTSESDAGEGALQNIAESIASLRQRETRRMPWGPDAHKHFAANYVSSPHKIMTGRFKCGRHAPPCVRLRAASASSSSESTSKAHYPPKEMESRRAIYPTHGPSARATVSPSLTLERRNDVQLSPPRKTRRLSIENGSPSVPQGRGSDRANEGWQEVTPRRSSPERRTVPAHAPPFPPVRGASPLPTRQLMKSGKLKIQSSPPLTSSITEQQARSPCALATPIGAATQATEPHTSTPHTVAKPLTALVARQLSFEEEGDLLMKHKFSGEDAASLATATCTVVSVVHE